MKFLSRFLTKKQPPTQAELDQKLEDVKDLLEQYSDIGRGALAFIRDNNVTVEMQDMPPKKQGAFFRDENKIILNYNKPLHKLTDILVHETVHAAQVDTTMAYDLSKPFTPFKTMMLQRLSEAQAFVIGAAAAHEVTENMKAEDPAKAAEFTKGFKAEPQEAAYAQTLTQDAKKPIQALRAAFDAFFLDPKSELHNYDQNIGYDCEYNTERYTNSPELQNADIANLHLSDVTAFGQIPFGNLKDRNFLSETGATSLTTEKYATIRDDWVRKNMGEAEMFQRWAIRKNHDIEEKDIPMRKILSDLKVAPTAAKPAPKTNKTDISPA